MASHFKRTDVDEARAGEVAWEDDDLALAPVGRHARRPGAVRAQHGTSASVTGAFQRLDPSMTGSFAAIAADDLQPIATPVAAADDAPRPIGVDPAVTGSFARITPEMAARAVTRDTAADAASAARTRADATPSRRLRRADQPSVVSHQTRMRGGRRIYAAVAVAAVAVLVLAGVTLRRMVTPASDASSASADAAATQAAPTDAIAYAGTTYELAETEDGAHVLTARAEGSAEAVNVAVINGEPAQLLAYNGSIIVPESYADGTWDVIAYTPGGDALATQVVGADGEPVHGEGAITEALLDGDSLVIADTTGAATTISLVG